MKGQPRKPTKDIANLAIAECVRKYFSELLSEPTIDCVVWPRGKHKNGYGRIKIGSDNIEVLAHRLSYFLYFGFLRPDYEVMHHCDNPSCVNPLHLSMGTPVENQAHAKERGRKPLGSKVGTAKLTEEQVLEIRRIYKPGIPYHPSPTGARELAKKYGCGRSAILKVITREWWKHI